VLTVITGNLTSSSDGVVLALGFEFVAVGFLVAVRQPANPIGWVLIASGLCTAFTLWAALYTLYDFVWAGKDAVDMAAVQSDLAGVVRATLHPAHLSIWVRRDDG